MTFHWLASSPHPFKLQKPCLTWGGQFLLPEGHMGMPGSDCEPESFTRNTCMCNWKVVHFLLAD